VSSGGRFLVLSIGGGALRRYMRCIGGDRFFAGQAMGLVAYIRIGHLLSSKAAGIGGG